MGFPIPSNEVEKMYIKWCATGVRAAKDRDKLEITNSEWDELIFLSSEDKPLPSRYAKYTKVFKIIVSHTRLSAWLADHTQEKAEEFVNAVKKYGEVTESDFIKFYTELQHRESK